MRADTLERAASLAGRGALLLGSLVSERHPFAEAGNAFASLAAYRSMKIVVDVTGA